MIPTRLHAIADYLVPAGIAALSLSPRRGRATRRIMRVGPVWHLAYTMLTRHEGGFVPAIGMRTHLACDAVGALSFVGAAALLHDEPTRERWLLAALGLAELAVIAVSDREPPRHAIIDHRPSRKEFLDGPRDREAVAQEAGFHRHERTPARDHDRPDRRRYSR